MILIIGDVHGQFQVLNEQIQFAESFCECTIDAVIVLGDMGIYEHSLSRYFVTVSQCFKRPVYFLDGNHEEFSRFESLVESYKDFMTHLPRGQVTRICDINFLSLGGACYMDALNSPPGSEIRDQDIDLCLANRPEDVDLIISHDCPSGIGVPGTPGFEFYGKPGFARSQELVARFKPRKWFFGHHHRWFNARIENTEFLGLPESWKGFGLLDAAMNYRKVEHQVAIGQTWLQWLIKKLFG
ncbi:MAG: metallophosphoesterase [Candidatus Riflebacteria bacterium]|jgi:predicted phosphodiesterase|nr:metallophosphoesterase [Candidatus Riflebacteria bacterium]